MTLRITPTPVGNTSSDTLVIAASKDHPHTCGEHKHLFLANHNHQGSPPHLWGTHPGRLAEAEIVRITPTPVGNTGPVTR